MSESTNEAAIPNPALSPLQALIGKWNTVGTHQLVPGTTFHGQTSFEWMAGGAFIIMHSQVDEKEIPSGIAVFGSDDQTGEFFMLYFDERTVSRKYNVSFQDNILKWWRDTPEFSQRNTLTFSVNGNEITGKGEMCKDGKIWEGDLEQTFTRRV